MSGIFQRAKLFMEKRPLLFNSVVYGSFYTAAEFAQQSYAKIFKLPQPGTVILDGSARPADGGEKRLQDSTSKVATYNWAQLQRYAVYGCFLAGPMLHGWYKWLDGAYKGKSMRIVLMKLFADQFILTPPLITIFFISMSFMEGTADVFNECKVKFIQTFKTSCMYWLPVQFVNFLMIPPTFRVSFVGIAAFCWVNILCYLKSAPMADFEKGEINH